MPLMKYFDMNKYMMTIGMIAIESPTNSRPQLVLFCPKKELNPTGRVFLTSLVKNTNGKKKSFQIGTALKS